MARPEWSLELQSSHMLTPSAPRRVPCWASTQSQPHWTGGLLERLKGLRPRHGRQRRRWATSWLVPSASRGNEFHRATCSPGVGEARRCPRHGLRGPCVSTHLSLSSCWSSSSGNGMCFCICLTLLVKDLSPSFPLPVLSLSPAVSVSLCLSLTVLSYFFFFSLWLLPGPNYFTSFYCTIFSLSLYCALAVHSILHGCKILLLLWGPL